VIVIINDAAAVSFAAAARSDKHGTQRYMKPGFGSDMIRSILMPGAADR
jgi:hypothetical protein